MFIINYIILNDAFEQINLKNFTEVDINGDERIDGIFGEFTPRILEQLNNNSGRGENVFREQWLLRDRGVLFMVFKFPENVLHDQSGKTIKKIIRTYDEKNFYLEIWSCEFKNKWEYFLIAINKNLGFHTMNDINPFLKEKDTGIKKICQKIEKIIEI